MPINWSAAFRSGCAIAVGLAVSGTLRADDPLRLQEKFPANYQYHVNSRVELSGSVTPPAEKGQPAPKPLPITGHSALEYDERILAAEADGKTLKALRLYRKVELQRKMGDVPQESDLRSGVRRLVLVRAPQGRVTFSPDGPLTWGEIDLISKEVFTPALTALLPERPVRVGERWPVGMAGVAELTDMVKLEEGGLECKLEELTTLAGRKHARVTLTGTVRGVNEDGPNRQQLDGYYYFDLESNHLSYLSLHGVHWLLDKDGKEAGKVEGRFVLTRQANQHSADLADDALRGVALEPNAENTRLLYDNPDLGVRLLLPRNWRVGDVRGRQLTVDEIHGNGFLLTLDPVAKLPTAAQFQTEARDFLTKQKAKILNADAPLRLQGAPRELDAFALEMEMGGQRALMAYYVLKQDKGGATIAARLLPEGLAERKQELERIARSIEITGAAK